MNTVFLGIRVLHVLAAALWLGSVAFVAFVLMPAMERSGPAGDRIMGAMHRGGLGPYFGSISGVTVLSGLYLYWRFTAGFDPSISGSLGGIAFGTGGALGLIAGILGGSVVGRSATKAATLGESLDGIKDAARRSAVEAEIRKHKQRMVSVGRLVVGLLVITITLMAVGHYV